MVYVFLADGFEEIEALTPIDCLRRCGVEVKTVGVGKLEITGAHKIVVRADIMDNEIVLDNQLEMIVLPGGMPGTLNLAASQNVQKAIKYCYENKAIIGAICAAPSILGEGGYLEHKQATCFPGYEDKLIGAEYTGNKVTVDDNIITARGAGVSLDFSFELITQLIGKSYSKELEKKLQC